MKNLGFKEAIDQLGSRSIGINRERLAKALYELGVKSPNWEIIKKDKRIHYKAYVKNHYNMADAIISQEKQLIEYQEGK